MDLSSVIQIDLFSLHITNLNWGSFSFQSTMGWGKHGRGFELHYAAGVVFYLP